MNKLIELGADITQKRGLVLIVTKDRARKSKTDLIAKLIMKEPLFLIAGDEWVPGFVLPRMIRRQTIEFKKIMDRLRFTRASTCYQLLDSLANTDLKGDPILVTEFFHTFYDADIPLNVRLLKLRECCRELERLAFYRPVIVMIREMESEEYKTFMPALSSIADMLFAFEPEIEVVRQPALF